MTDRDSERRRDGETETRVKDLLASGVPPKGLEARAFTFGGTEGSMLGRRGWFDAVTKRFDAGKKGMIQCCDKNNGSMLNRKKGLMVVNINKKHLVKHISSHTYYLPHQFSQSANCYYYFHHAL